MSLPAGRHVFSSITIGKNGQLQIIGGSREATEIVVLGNVSIDGVVRAEGFSSEPRQHSFALPTGHLVSVSYHRDNRGGDGADGDFQGGNSGGRGGEGTTASGGGGGAGGVLGRDGMDASGRRGGGRRPACGTYGGNGTYRDPYATGGTVYLEVHGDFYGSPSTGKFFLTGGSGADGIFGENFKTVATPVCDGAAGGGGGGAPGNSGGHLLVFVKGRIGSYPSVYVQGGTGGRGGAGGTRKAGGRADTGKDGEQGAAGTARFFDATGAIRAQQSADGRRLEEKAD